MIEPTAYSIPDFGISVGLSNPRVETRISPKSALSLTVPILINGHHLPSCPREKPRYHFLLFPLSKLIYPTDHLIMRNHLSDPLFSTPTARLSPTLFKQVLQPPNRLLQLYVPSIEFPSHCSQRDLSTCKISTLFTHKMYFWLTLDTFPLALYCLLLVVLALIF